MGGAGAAAAAALVASSKGGKGVFNIREKFLDFDVLGIGGPSELVERPLDDLVTVCCCGCQVFEVGVEIFGKIRALGGEHGFLIGMGQVWLQGRCCGLVGRRLPLRKIFSPCKASLALKVLVEGFEGVLQGPPRLAGFWIPVPLRSVVGKGVCEEEG